MSEENKLQKLDKEIYDDFVDSKLEGIFEATIDFCSDRNIGDINFLKSIEIFENWSIIIDPVEYEPEEDEIPDVEINGSFSNKGVSITFATSSDSHYVRVNVSSETFDESFDIRF